MELVSRTDTRVRFLLRLSLWVAVAVVVLWAGSALAQSDAPAVAIPTDITADQVNEIAKELWCPLCNNIRLDTCELKACDQMKDIIAIKLSEGETLDEIRNYFVIQYGPQVLGEPPREGFNWLAWLLPIAALVVGGYAFWRKTHSLVQSAPAEAKQPLTPAGQPAAGADDYERKLEEELARYG